MKTNRANQVIIEILQKSLAGQLISSSNFNPQFVAEAIAAKVEFEKSYSNVKNDKAIGTIKDAVLELQAEASKELKNISEDEKLLKNFVHGQLTSYSKILDAINKL